MPPDAFGTSLCSWNRDNVGAAIDIIYVGIKSNLYRNLPHGTIQVLWPLGWTRFDIRNRRRLLPE